MQFLKGLLGGEDAPPTACAVIGNVPASVPTQQAQDISSSPMPRKKSYNIVYYKIDRKIATAVKHESLTMDHLRSSSSLRSVLNDIVSHISLFHCWGKQSVKVRLSSFIEFLVAQLCIPHIMSLYGVGSSILSFGMGLGTSDLEVPRTSSSDSTQHSEGHDLRSSTSTRATSTGSETTTSRAIIKISTSAEASRLQHATKRASRASSGAPIEASAGDTVGKAESILIEAFSFFKVSEELILDKGK